jgi:UDP-3-O-[3-hydroxymyristoyl] glucosamine N-acyltransferase
MINFNVNQFNSGYDFQIKGVSNIQSPKTNTMMFVGGKLIKYLNNLRTVKECLIFIESPVEIDRELADRHCFIESKNPALLYVKAVTAFLEEDANNKRQKKYTLTEGGYLRGEDVELGKDTFIEPDCFIDHGVKIGDNTLVLSGAAIRGNVTIGNNCIIKEKALIGSYGFIFTKDEEGNNLRIPSLGGVVISDNAEIGAFATICSGTAHPTCIDEYVKIDDHVHIAHDVTVGKNTIISAGSIVAGYAQLGERVYIGAGASIKNRLNIGSNSLVGMAARVYKNVKDKETVLNEPAGTLEELARRNILLNRLKE